jgi:hypothetical protein
VNHQNFERTLRCWDIPSSMPVGVAVPITHLFLKNFHKLLLKRMVFGALVIERFANALKNSISFVSTTFYIALVTFFW